MKTTYAAMPGGVLNATTAVIAGEELSRIEREYGAIKPADVVRESKPKEAKLHSYFTWDNSIASARWREEEARQIIRAVRVVVPDMPHAEQPVIRCYVSVKASEKETKFEGQGYIEIQRASRSKAYREQVLSSARAEILLWQRKYDDLLVFTGAKDHVQALVEGLTE